MAAGQGDSDMGGGQIEETASHPDPSEAADICQGR